MGQRHRALGDVGRLEHGKIATALLAAIDDMGAMLDADAIDAKRLVPTTVVKMTTGIPRARFRFLRPAAR
jgi:hypothetical protein